MTVSDPNKLPDSPALAPRPAVSRSRIANGSELLAGIDGRSTWARLFRDLCEALTVHLGGEDRMTEPERFVVRRASTMECELVFMESAFAATRAAGGAPTAGELDLYQRMSNSQRRLLESLGFDRRLRDAVPSLGDYLAGKEGPR